MDQQAVIRPARKEDAGALSQLFQKYYRQDKPAAYFEWQFFSPAPPAVCMVVESEGSLIGTCGCVQRTVTDGSLAGHIVDMLVEEEFRGQGIFPRLLTAAMAAFPEVALYVVLPNAHGLQAIMRQPKWVNKGTVPLYQYVPETANDDEAKDHATAASCGFAYDDVICAWRFAQHPTNRYETIDRGGLRGWVKVFSDPDDSSRKYGDIMQIEPASLDRLVDWLGAAIDWFATEGISDPALWAMDGGTIARAARRAGFKRREQARWLCLAPGQDKTAAERFWDVCSADAEFY